MVVSAVGVEQVAQWSGWVAGVALVPGALAMGHWVPWHTVLLECYSECHWEHWVLLECYSKCHWEHWERHWEGLVCPAGEPVAYAAWADEVA